MSSKIIPDSAPPAGEDADCDLAGAVLGDHAGAVLGLPRVIGHRGAAAAAPENTIASFRTAATMGVAMVEFDVKLTSDSQPVVFHDETLERTTNGHGRMRDTPLAALRSLDAGGWFEPVFAGEPAPTLEEVLAFLLGVGVRPNIEIKPCPDREQETARIVAAVATACWPSNRPPPLLSSFSRIALETVREEVPTWPRALIVDRLPPDWHEGALALGVSALHCQQRHLSPVAITELRRKGLAITAWTVNDPERARALWKWGVDAVVSDAPDIILGATS